MGSFTPGSGGCGTPCDDCGDCHTLFADDFSAAGTGVDTDQWEVVSGSWHRGTHSWTDPYGNFYSYQVLYTTSANALIYSKTLLPIGQPECAVQATIIPDLEAGDEARLVLGGSDADNFFCASVGKGYTQLLWKLAGAFEPALNGHGISPLTFAAKEPSLITVALGQNTSDQSCGGADYTFAARGRYQEFFANQGNPGNNDSGVLIGGGEITTAASFGRKVGLATGAVASGHTIYFADFKLLERKCVTMADCCDHYTHLSTDLDKGVVERQGTWLDDDFAPAMTGQYVGGPDSTLLFLHTHHRTNSYVAAVMDVQRFNTLVGGLQPHIAVDGSNSPDVRLWIDADFGGGGGQIEGFCVQAGNDGTLKLIDRRGGSETVLQSTSLEGRTSDNCRIWICLMKEGGTRKLTAGYTNTPYNGCMGEKDCAGADSCWFPFYKILSDTGSIATTRRGLIGFGTGPTDLGAGIYYRVGAFNFYPSFWPSWAPGRAFVFSTSAHDATMDLNSPFNCLRCDSVLPCTTTTTPPPVADCTCDGTCQIKCNGSAWELFADGCTAGGDVASCTCIALLHCVGSQCDEANLNDVLDGTCLPGTGGAGCDYPCDCGCTGDCWMYCDVFGSGQWTVVEGSTCAPTGHATGCACTYGGECLGAACTDSGVERHGSCAPYTADAPCTPLCVF